MTSTSPFTFLAGVTALLAVPLALVLGVTAALYRNFVHDKVVNAGTLRTINVLASPYIEMARLEGVSRRQAIVHHALLNAGSPIANVIAFNVAYLVVGVAVVEVVFVYPGIGQLMVDSVASRDIPAVQACAPILRADIRPS